MHVYLISKVELMWGGNSKKTNISKYQFTLFVFYNTETKFYTAFLQSGTVIGHQPVRNMYLWSPLLFPEITGSSRMTDCNLMLQDQFIRSVGEKWTGGKP